MRHKAVLFFLIILIATTLIIRYCNSSQIIDSAATNSEALADAIFMHENSPRHPYGVMIKCKDPRRVCLNTIAHARKDWNRRGDFIAFLNKRYAEDKNWAKSVRRIYEKLITENR